MPLNIQLREMRAFLDLRRSRRDETHNDSTTRSHRGSTSRDGTSGCRLGAKMQRSGMLINSKGFIPSRISQRAEGGELPVWSRDPVTRVRQSSQGVGEPP